MPNHITAETHRRETKERLVRIETIVDRMEVHLSKLMIIQLVGTL